MTTPRAVKGAVAMLAVAILALAAALSACGSTSGPSKNPSKNPSSATSAPPAAPAAVETALLNADQINPMMGTSDMTSSQPFTQLLENRTMLPNLNCLGIWSVAESAIYGDSGLTAIRGQVFRSPNDDNWQSKVVEAVITYPSADGAKKFFRASADRWSKCTQHTSRITVNDLPMTTLFFADLNRSDTRLTMPVTRNNDRGERDCQRDLSISNNVIIDVTACGKAVTDQAAKIADQIQSRLPH